MLSAYIALHLHSTPCSTAAQFFAWERPAVLCMSAATFACRITTLSRRAAVALLFDGQLGESRAAQFCRAEPHTKDDCCATSASPEEAKFKTCLSCSFRATHFPFLYGKTGRSPGCAAVSRNNTNHPGYVTTSVDGETMILVHLTTLMKESQQLLEFDVSLGEKNLCLNSTPGSEVV